jgi:hypothetical protein
MRIALIGNMNNNFFALLRYLLDMGLDAYLLLQENELSHFTPNDDCYDLKNYENRIIKVNWGSYKKIFFTNTFKKDVAAYDVIIGSRAIPAYCKKNNVALNLYIPTGDDIQKLPFFNGFNPKNFIKWLLVASLQRKGIQKAKAVLWDKTNEIGEQKFASLEIEGTRLEVGIPMLYWPEYTHQNIEKQKQHILNYVLFEKLREKHDLIVVHHCRHSWSNISESDWAHDKANNRLFTAFAKIVKEKVYKNPLIITLEYGKDVALTKKLIDDLGIKENIQWMPLTSRKEIMAMIFFCDIVAGEFKNSWFSYGVVYEAMCMKKPIMHHRNNSLYSNKNSLYSMLHAETEEEIYETIKGFKANSTSYEKIGQKGYEWFLKEAIEKPLQSIQNSILNN